MNNDLYQQLLAEVRESITIPEGAFTRKQFQEDLGEGVSVQSARTEIERLKAAGRIEEVGKIRGTCYFRIIPQEE